MVGDVIGDGRLLSLCGFDWPMLIASCVMGLLILMF
jgi:hypothetical protein